MFMGDSVGHWEGDTLVVDTANQNGRTWFDMVGNFTTPNIHVVERITPIDSNAISYEATIEDSTIYTRPRKIAGSAVPTTRITSRWNCLSGRQPGPGALHRGRRRRG
jgi:hypothetical protein